MNTVITWQGNTKTLDLPNDENSFYKGVSDVLSNLPAPNRAEIRCDGNGCATYDIIRRGGGAFIREDTNSLSITPGANYPEVHLVCINPNFNNYKFYRLRQHGNEVVATYGRIGAGKGEAFGEREYRYPSRMFWIKYQEKLAKGYVDQSSVYLASPVTAQHPNNASKGNDRENGTPGAAALNLYRLLRSFAKQRVDESCVSSVVTEAMARESRKFLTAMYGMKTVTEFNDQLLKLMAVCPRRVRQVASLLANKTTDFPSIIAREEGLVAAMEAIAAPAVSAAREGFQEVEVYTATAKQRNEVMDLLSPTLHGKVSEIYRVINKPQKARFDAYLKKNGIRTVKQLWHGSRNENWLSIVQNSLALRPDAIITGKMFGDGIYFAPSSLKSWNYTSFHGTHWARGTSDDAFMGLYATAYGTPLNVHSSQRFSQSTLGGKNCVHAHAGTALLNDEIIYYSEDAITINYLVRFRK